MNQQLFQQVDEYINGLFLSEDDTLAAVVQSIADADMPQHSISANQGRFLQLLATLSNAGNILEIGTLGGYSTIWLGRSLKPRGRLITIEANADYAKVARQNIERADLAHCVEIRVGKGLDILPKLEQENCGPFDMIFIDADKPPYKEYFEWALRLSHPGTLIVADNVIREGKVLNPQHEDEKVKGVQRFNTALAANNKVLATIIQTIGAKEFDGMALAIVK